MRTEARLAVKWEPEVPAAFRASLESAFSALLVDAYDTTETDPDPDASAVARLWLVAPTSTGLSAGRDTNLLIVLCGEDGPASLPRLEMGDIGGRSPRWLGFLRRLGDALDRPGLPGYADAGGDPDLLNEWALRYPADPLAKDVVVSMRPDVLLDRAAGAEADRDLIDRELRGLRRDLDASEHGRSQATRDVAKLAQEKAELESRVRQLEMLAEEGAYPLSLVPAGQRTIVDQARSAAARARHEATLGRSHGETHPFACSWPGAQAFYDGETRNALPHGHGVMWFGAGKSRFAGYCGRFVDGRREGLGVGRDADGTVWSGEWRDDQASGLGVLDSSDGRRFEGRVGPGPDGPTQQDGWVWPAPGQGGRAAGQVRVQPRALLTDARKPR
jgi:hypothetical protein